MRPPRSPAFCNPTRWPSCARGAADRCCFQREAAKIGEWLAVVRNLPREDYKLALDVAQLPGLLKGYGDTHARGSREFDTLLNALPELRRGSGPAARFKELREAALKGEER